jgi:hypothetical protein
MSIEFPAERWNVSAGDEVMAEHFEDIRKAIWRRWSIMNRDLDFDDLTPWVNPYYAEPGDIRTRNGIAWIATGEGILGEPGVDGGWSEYALSYRYSHFCDNSSKVRHRLVEGNVSRFPPSTGYLPLQVTRANNPKNGSTWGSGTAYVKGNIVLLYDAQNICFSFRCKTDHTSSAANRPYAGGWNWGLDGFDNLRSTYWVLVGEPYCVVTKNRRTAGDFDWYLSRKIGATYPTDRSIGHYPYHVDNGVPAEPNPLDSVYNDDKYWEYQSAVERICEAYAWYFDTGFSDFIQTTPTATPIDRGDSWRWDCNQSTFELILKKLGEYDWYFDVQNYPDKAGSNPPRCPVCNQLAHPVWRRTWRHSMRLSDTASFRLRDKDAYRPLASCSAYSGFSWTYNGHEYNSWNELCDDNVQHIWLADQNWQDATPADPYHLDNPNMDAVRIRHTYSHWHGNPPAAILNDMKDVLLWLKYIPVRVVCRRRGRWASDTEPFTTGSGYDGANQAGYERALAALEQKEFGDFGYATTAGASKHTHATKWNTGFPSVAYYGGDLSSNYPSEISEVQIGVKLYIAGYTGSAELPAYLTTNINGIFLDFKCYAQEAYELRTYPDGPPPDLLSEPSIYWSARKNSDCSLVSDDGTLSLNFPLYTDGPQPVETVWVWCPVSLSDEWFVIALKFADQDTACPLPSPPAGDDEWIFHNYGGMVCLHGEQEALFGMPVDSLTTGANFDFNLVPIYE